MRWIVLGLLICNGPLYADVYFQPTTHTQQLITQVEHGNCQNIQLLIEQGADVNAHVDSSPLFIQAIEDLGQELQLLEESSTKLWIARGLIGLGVAGLLWAGYSHFFSREMQREIKHDHPDDLSTDDVSPAQNDPLKHTDMPDNTATSAERPDVPEQPNHVKQSAPIADDPVQESNADHHEEPVAARPQAQSAVDDSDDDSPPPPQRHLQQPLQQAPVDINKDKRGNALPPKLPVKATSAPVLSQPQTAPVKSHVTTSDNKPTTSAKIQKPGLWKRFKHWVSPVKGMQNNSHRQIDIAPLYAGAVISGLTIARTVTKRKGPVVEIADRVAVIMALLDVPELDLQEKNQSGETVLNVLDRYLRIIKNEQSKEVLMAIYNSIRLELDSVLD